MNRGASVLLVGAGGLGSPAALVLAKSGIERVTILDDDAVDETNLHRQILFDRVDVGHDKAERAAARLVREGVVHARAIRGRLLPSNALELVRAHDLVVEGADNFATKFLAADACAIAGVPLASAGAVRWSGWAFASAPGGPCLRCVFEDIPSDRVDTCAEAGVIGSVVGLVGAIEAALAIRLLCGDERASGELWSYDGLSGKTRARRVRRRAGCALCERQIRDLCAERYAPPHCSI